MRPIPYELRVFSNIIGISTSISGLFSITVFWLVYRDQGVGSAFLLLFGLIAFAIPIFGCIAYIKLNPTMIWINAAIMFILVIGKLDLLLTVLTSKNLNAELESNLEEVFRKNRIEMDIAQKAYECCGLSGPDDYKDIGLELPQSCYSYDKDMNQTLHINGCRNDMVKNITSFVRTIIISLWINFFVEVSTAFTSGGIAIITFQEE